MIKKSLFALLTLATISGITIASDCYSRSRIVSYSSYVTPYVAPVKAVVKEYAAVQAAYVPIPVYTAVYIPPAGYVHPTPNPSPMTQSNGDSQSLSDMARSMKLIAEGMQSIDGRVRALENRLGLSPGTPPPGGPPERPPPGGMPPANGGTKPGGPVDPFNPGGTPPGAGAVKEADVKKDMLSLVTAKCAACHDVSNAEKEGKSLVLLRDDVDGKKVLAPLNDKQKSRLVTTAYRGDMPKDHPTIKIPKLTDQEVGLIIAYVDSLK